MRRRLLLALPLAACAAAPAPMPMPEDLGVIGSDPFGDPAYPYPMGTIEAVWDGAPVTWGVWDYSVGAIDPAAFVNTLDDPPRFSLNGDREGFQRETPDREIGALGLREGTLAGPAPGPVAGAEVTLRLGEPGEGLPGWTSRGRPAEVVVETLDPGNGNAPYGRMTGRFSATLCRVAGPGAGPDLGNCRPIAGIFDTKVYVGS